jgi:two-component system sensor histidine kinase/response regulator
VPPDLFGDPQRLRQILLNLLGNAVKFTERGEVVLRVENDPGADQGTLLFTVSDTGIGIQPEKAALIFDSFAQADSGITRTHGGTGLGLTISKHLVEKMGGRIWVESTPGVGSKFCFTAKFDIQAAPRRQPGDVGDLKGLNALVVDDNATNRAILRQMLDSWGAAVTEAVDGRAAIAELERAQNAQSQYDLVLLDRRMPEMDGFAVAEHVRTHPDLARTTILMLTSDNRSADAARCRELGMDAYLVKPVRRAELLRSICQAIEGPQAQQMSATEPERGVSPHQAPVLRVLLADDSEDNLFLIQSYLHENGYAIETAANGEQAVEKFTHGRFDLVLMDMQMPLMDGYAATTHIRIWEREHERPATPIIALTAYASEADVSKSLEAGCTAHLSKPIRKDTLLTTISEFAPGTPSHDRIEIRIPGRLQDILPSYLERRRADVAALTEALERSDYESARTIGHRMKGSGSGYGLDRLTEIGAAIEGAAVENNSEQLAEQRRRLLDFLDTASIIYD